DAFLVPCYFSDFSHFFHSFRVSRGLVLASSPGWVQAGAYREGRVDLSADTVDPRWRLLVVLIMRGFSLRGSFSCACCLSGIPMPLSVFHASCNLENSRTVTWTTLGSLQL